MNVYYVLRIVKRELDFYFKHYLTNCTNMNWLCIHFPQYNQWWLENLNPEY